MCIIGENSLENAMALIEATKTIKSKGWSVSAACLRWGMNITTYRRYAKNPDDPCHYRVIDLINGLGSKAKPKDFKDTNAAIKAKGWTIRDACSRWGMTPPVYRAYINDRNNPRRNRMIDLIAGLPDRSISDQLIAQGYEVITAE